MEKVFNYIALGTLGLKAAIMRKIVISGLVAFSIVLILAVFDEAEKERSVTSPTKVPEKQEPTRKKKVIFQFDNPEHQSVLNTPTQPVKKLPDPKVDALVNTMHSMMTDNVGGGISANQIGEPLQVFLIGPPPMISTTAPSDVFINPVITKTSKERVCFWHGCLSSRKKPFGKTATWKEITIRAQGLDGNTFTRDLTGLDAIVAQHEFRHLLGGGYQDHAEEFHEEMELTKLMLQKKEKMIELCDEKAPFLLEGYRVGETIQEYAKRAAPKQLKTQGK